jgi:DNA polymerase IV (DinB-like DNA polymerase)
MERVVFHVDMDSFYAACEERENPGWKGKPLVVCVYSVRGGGSGVVSTANYEARRLGVHSGMSCLQAKKRAPEAVFLPVNRPLYEQVSERVMNFLRGEGDAFEAGGIDEAFLDVTRRVGGDYGRARALAERLKREIVERERLTCSIGVAPNRLLAKIASGRQKPDGLTVIEPHQVQEFLGPLKPIQLWGVGEKTAAALEEMGISTVADLAEVDPLVLVERFGKARGAWLYNAAHGRDDSRVEEKSRAEQIGRIMTLPRNTREPEEILEVLEELVDAVHRTLRERGLSFRSATFLAVTGDLKTHTRSRTLETATEDRGILLDLIRGLMEAFLEESEIEVRRVGVRVSALRRTSGQRSLLEYGGIPRTDTGR